MRRKKMLRARDQAWGFTLIELLIVIAVLALLAVAVILTLNPAELLRQARDSTRLSDLENLNKGVSFYSADLPDGYFGEAQTLYISLPDPQATSTQGTNCASLGLPPLPSGWSYHCAIPANLRNVDGTGWIPIDFRKASFRAVFANLPVDPINTLTSGLYYTYQQGSWEFSAVMESQKFGRGGPNDVASNDKGKYDEIYEVGSSLMLLPINRAALALSTSTPQVVITSPAPSAVVSGTVSLAATATDTVGIYDMQFLLDGGNLGSQITTPPYQIFWDTTLVSNGVHGLSARATNNALRSETSASVSVTVSNVSSTLPALQQFTVISNAPANTCDAQLNSSVTAGNLLVLTVDTNSSTAAISVNDNRGNVWQTAVVSTSTAGTQAIYYALNAISGITNVTSTITNWGDALRSCELAEYSGITAFDAQSSLTGTGTQLWSGTSTTNFTNELIVGAGSTPNCLSCTPTPSPGFIIVSASAKSFQEYRVVTSAGGYSAGASVAASTPWLMNMATFR